MEDRHSEVIFEKARVMSDDWSERAELFNLPGLSRLEQAVVALRLLAIDEHATDQAVDDVLERISIHGLGQRLDSSSIERFVQLGVSVRAIGTVRASKEVIGVIDDDELADAASVLLIFEEMTYRYGLFRRISTAMTACCELNLLASMAAAYLAAPLGEGPSLMTRMFSGRSAWRLQAPQMSESQAQAYQEEMAASLKSMGADYLLADRATGVIAGHAIDPVNPGIKKIAAAMEVDALKTLGMIHELSKDIFTMTLPKDSAEFFMTLLIHAGYRSMLFGKAAVTRGWGA